MSRMKPVCMICGSAFSPRRARAGYKVCLFCGEEAARAERASWCVVQEYGKGAYQFVTQQSAHATLRQTNQKNPR